MKHKSSKSSVIDSDWVKKVSSSFTALDGVKFETHWVENLKTGERILEKTVMDFIKQ